MKKASYKKAAYWIVSLIILGFAVFFFQKNLDQWEQVKSAVSRFGATPLFLTFAFVSLQLFFQGLRLWVLIPKRTVADIPRAEKALVFGQVLNAFLPARAGDAVKVMQLTRPDLPLSSSIGVLLADKVVDTCSFLVLCLVASPFWAVKLPLPESMPLTKILAIGGAVLGFVVALPWLFPKLRVRLSEMIHSFRNGLGELKRPKPLSMALVFSWLGWLSEMACLALLAWYQGQSLTVPQVVWVLAVLNIGIAVPVAIANVGAFEGSMVIAFQALSVESSVALAIALVHHLGQIITVLFWGAILWAISRFRKKVEKTAVNNAENRF